jgi:hypothetical protein
MLQQRGRAKDPVAYLHDVEQRARERQVAYETVRLLRQRVRLTPSPSHCSLSSGCTL